MLKGLASKKLPEMLAECKNEMHAEMVLDFAAATAYHADSKVPTWYAAQYARAYLENNDQTATDKSFAQLNAWIEKHPSRSLKKDFVKLFVKFYLTEK